jgi:prolyl oligopeptidase
MFVLRSRTATLPAPVELYGYGGFNISLTPGFDPSRLAFLEAGGVVVVANLRGGSENGEEWHQQGMLGNKQQVFDDFIACAERLIADGIAAPGTIGIRGRSNGGLLTAACMVQRPDLFGAVSCGVPVTDMLRYQHFTAGRYWTVEYGDAADEAAFRWLIEYSPLHNVTAGAAYPPTLIVTADTDDRVVPMHAFKFGAALQHASGGASDQPLLLRVETRAGHGLGKPTSKIIEERADEYAFFLHHLAPPRAES